MSPPTGKSHAGQQKHRHESAQPHDPSLSFRQRAIYIVVVVATVAIALLLLWTLRWVFCLAFLAILLAVFLRGGAELLRRAAQPIVKLKEGTSLGLFGLLLVAAITAFFFLAVPSLSKQVGELRGRFPESVEKIKTELRQSRWGTWVVHESEAIVDQVRPATTQSAPGDSATRQTSDAAAQPHSAGAEDPAGLDLRALFRQAAGWASSFLTAVFAGMFVLFAAIYLAVEPQMYTRGILWLVPPRGRMKADCVLKRIGRTLRYWLLGQMCAMGIVGLLSGVGLWILGAPLPLVLGSLAAIAEFVPNVGPFLAATLPTILSATAQGRFLSGPSLAVAVLVLFILIQSLESYVITPLIQRRAVELPPALLIVTQISAAFILGAVGVIIAAPLIASIMAAVRELYVVGDPAHEDPQDRAQG